MAKSKQAEESQKYDKIPNQHTLIVWHRRKEQLIFAIWLLMTSDAILWYRMLPKIAK